MLFNSLTFLVFTFAGVFLVHQLLRNWVAGQAVAAFGELRFLRRLVPGVCSDPRFFHDAGLVAGSSYFGDARAVPSAHILDDCQRCSQPAAAGFFQVRRFRAFQYPGRFDDGRRVRPVPTWNIALPIGISFYTFASLSYTIDVYRGEVRRPAQLARLRVLREFFSAPGGGSDRARQPDCFRRSSSQE